MPTTDLFAAARRCLSCADPAQKVALTQQTASDFRAGKLKPAVDDQCIEAISTPGRPERPHLIEPRKLAQRGLGSAEGRAALRRLGLDIQCARQIIEHK